MVIIVRNLSRRDNENICDIIDHISEVERSVGVCQNMLNVLSNVFGINGIDYDEVGQMRYSGENENPDGGSDLLIYSRSSDTTYEFAYSEDSIWVIPI